MCTAERKALGTRNRTLTLTYSLECRSVRDAKYMAVPDRTQLSRSAEMCMPVHGGHVGPNFWSDQLRRRGRTLHCHRVRQLGRASSSRAEYVCSEQELLGHAFTNGNRARRKGSPQISAGSLK